MNQSPERMKQQKRAHGWYLRLGVFFPSSSVNNMKRGRNTATSGPAADVAAKDKAESDAIAVVRARAIEVAAEIQLLEQKRAQLLADQALIDRMLAESSP